MILFLLLFVLVLFTFVVYTDAQLATCPCGQGKAGS